MHFLQFLQELTLQQSYQKTWSNVFWIIFNTKSWCRKQFESNLILFWNNQYCYLYNFVHFFSTFAEKRWNLGVDFSTNFQSGVDFLLIFQKNKIVTGKDDILETKFSYIKAIYHWMWHILLRDSHTISVNTILFACISAINCFIHDFQNLKCQKLKIWGGLFNIFEISSWFCKCVFQFNFVVWYRVFINI